MFNTISGTITSTDNKYIYLATGPMGLALQVPNPAVFPLKKPVIVHIYMHWNSENGPSFYGFANETEKQIFELILSCSGIGPKIGLAVLGDIGATSFIQAVQLDDEKLLSKVSGIGAKKAQQMIFQLRSKVEKLLATGVSLGSQAQAVQEWHTVTQALESLNYSRSEINRVMSQLKKEMDPNVPFDQLMRKALGLLAK